MIGSQRCDLFTNIALLFALNRIFFSANENGAVKKTNQILRLFLTNQSHCRKMKDKKDIFWQMCDFKVGSICILGHLGLVFIWSRFVSCLLFLLFYVSIRNLSTGTCRKIHKVAIKLRVVQFWSEIILVISNRIRAARSFDFEITRMISDQIALHSVQFITIL